MLWVEGFMCSENRVCRTGRFPQNGFRTLLRNKRGYRNSLVWIHFRTKKCSLLVLLWNSGQLNILPRLAIAFLGAAKFLQCHPISHTISCTCPAVCVCASRLKSAAQSKGRYRRFERTQWLLLLLLRRRTLQQTSAHHKWRR